MGINEQVERIRDMNRIWTALWCLALVSPFARIIASVRSERGNLGPRNSAELPTRSPCRFSPRDDGAHARRCFQRLFQWGLLGVGCLALSAGGQTIEEPSFAPFLVEMRVAEADVAADSEFGIGIYCADTTQALGGFNLLFEYDYGALVLDSATLGSLTAGQWEYFDISTGFVNQEDESDLRTWVRLVAIADSHSEPEHPVARSLVGPGELARCYFYATEALAGDSTAVRWLWRGCGDNSFSDGSGNKLLIAAEADTSGVEVSYQGPPAACFDNSVNPPMPQVKFKSLRLKPKPRNPILPDSS